MASGQFTDCSTCELKKKKKRKKKGDKKKKKSLISSYIYTVINLLPCTRHKNWICRFTSLFLDKPDCTETNLIISSLKLQTLTSVNIEHLPARWSMYREPYCNWPPSDHRGKSVSFKSYNCFTCWGPTQPASVSVLPATGPVPPARGQFNLPAVKFHLPVV